MGTVRKERVVVDGVLIENFVEKEIVTSLRGELGPGLTPIGLVFISQSGVPVLVNHETLKEIQDKIVHIASPDETLIEKFVKVLLEAKTK